MPERGKSAKRIDGLIRQLGDPAYAVRERALADLVACGLSAVGPLRQAQRDPDVEIAWMMTRRIRTDPFS